MTYIALLELCVDGDETGTGSTTGGNRLESRGSDIRVGISALVGMVGAVVFFVLRSV